MQRAKRGVLSAAALSVMALVAAACGGGGTTGGGGGVALPSCLSTADLYALVGPESEGFAQWSDANQLAQEVGGIAAPYPDAPLAITAPGEESGTYDAFVELAEFEDMGVERGLSEDEAATTRPDYQASANDNVIIEGIAGTQSSFGWVGYSFYEQNQEVVQAFEITSGDEGGCTAPSFETISDGSYPLSRSLFIYVNNDKAAESSALQAYVDLYTSDQGLRTAVEEVAYVVLPDDRIAQTQQTWADAKAAFGGSGAPTGELFISGSSTVEPISSLVAEFFAEQSPEVSVSVEGPGTGDGFELFCEGETDISDASRPIDPEEAAVCEENGIEYTELEVALDGISVLTAAQG
jgi:ABC-type phosphate transport system substrate-binding protein